jgi:molybdenum cofactor cytidylyltransferase
MRLGVAVRGSHIVPIILAAGPRHGLPFPKALAPFDKQTALERALDNCLATPGSAAPIIVLGCHARRVISALRRGRRASRAGPLPATVVSNAHWRSGQLSSLLAGLRRLPAQAEGFLLYPVDYPLLTPRLLARLARAFSRRAGWQQIVVPAIGRRTGHPILVARELAAEFRACARHGGTARDVIYRATRPDRVLRVPVRDVSIFRDFDSLASYRRCLRLSRLREHRRARARGNKRPL